MKKRKKKNRPSAGTEDRKVFKVEVTVKNSNGSQKAQALKKTIIKAVLQAPFRNRAVKLILESAD